ncbi:MAG: FG-GAP-like repeat-containing protein [Anaerolineae bacterium]
MSNSLKVDAGPTLAEYPAEHWQLRGARIEDSSPTLANVDADPELEILIGGLDGTCGGRLYAYNSNGSELWSVQTSGPINSTPAVADIDGDNQVEVVVGVGGWSGSEGCADGGVLAVNGASGAQEWFFTTADWLNHSPDGHPDGVFSSPTIGDVDGDGDLEIAFGAWDQCIYLLDGSGNAVWGTLPGVPAGSFCNDRGFYNEDTIWSSPVFFDLTGDGKREIIIGADITAGNRSGDPSGGYLYVLDKDGNQLAREWVDQAIYSSPAVADLDNDNNPEIVVGSGLFLDGQGYYVTAYNYNGSASTVTDRLVQKWKATTAGRVFSSPALGDLNEDGVLDVAITAFNGDWGNDGSWVYALNGANGSTLWVLPQCDRLNNSFPGRSSPTLADIDGDDHLEVLFSHAWEVTIINHNGVYYTDHGVFGSGNAACNAATAGTSGVYYLANYSIFGAPAVGDIDLDNDLEIVVGGAFAFNDNSSGGLHVWRNHPMAGDDKMPWPMFHHDAQNTGHFPRPPALSVSPTSLLVMHQFGDTGDARGTLQIQNTGDGSFDWSASASQPVTVTLSSGAGTVVTGMQVSVTVETSGYVTGTYSLGSISVNGTSGGNPVTSSPASIPVTLFVGQVYDVYLPLTLK